ncbi:DNA/RNA non-specific endonuclease [Brachyspira hyodysenteriae]|uniref:DNA/RNA non-specific endonuclease n=1 Tax=Brachyspira hyodysenteriae TaxID=159 RepID=UPI002B25EB91|nr:DNA/RNA non-specific endonuclease [Brachyspira hyodysenteriae]WPC23716.1 DNA/RNA non-specific endonuclease [Brachyspira hyodysenteriae]
MRIYIYCIISIIFIISCQTNQVYNIKNDDDKSHFVKINRIEYLKPNIKYNINGTLYSTDKQSRIYKVIRKENLILSNAKRNNYAKRKVVELYGIKDHDQGGHIIGRQFGGSPNIDNLIPINKKLNIGEMRKTEMEWRESIINGDEMNDIVIDIKYIYTNMRPNIIIINYDIEKDYTNYRIQKIFTND